VYVAEDPLVSPAALLILAGAALAVTLLASAWPAWRIALGSASRGLREE